ncbi:MAG TPA: S26 family signal peptidase, partial [Allosphingosinicella sp.]|nr:S26 family signal peptidase [Allosphingosinicella sp.]
MAGRDGKGRSRILPAAVMAGLALVAAAGLTLRATGAIPSVHAYYIPSEAMMPTLVKDDRILAATGVSRSLTRGEIILFRARTG